MRNRVAIIPNPRPAPPRRSPAAPPGIDQPRILVDHPGGTEAELRQEPVAAALAVLRDQAAGIAHLRDLAPCPRPRCRCVTGSRPPCSPSPAGRRARGRGRVHRHRRRPCSGRHHRYRRLADARVQGQRDSARGGEQVSRVSPEPCIRHRT